jgi:hypothetical protein
MTEGSLLGSDSISMKFAVASEGSGGGALQPLQGFMTNPAGAAVVTAIGPIRQLVRGDDKVQRRYLVIAPGMVDGPGAGAGAGGMIAVAPEIERAPFPQCMSPIVMHLWDMPAGAEDVR